MPKIKLYHGKTVLCTYLVWSFLLLLVACWLCRVAQEPLTTTPRVWVILHIAPLYGLMPLYPRSIGIPIVVAAGLSFAAGVLINRRWARYLVIAGMSLWFLWAAFFGGLGV